MDVFPLFMKLEGRPCLVVGGGGAAVRKVELLQRAGARVTVVAPVLAREVRLAIERLLPPALGRLARFAERFRAAVKAAIPDALRRRRFWESFFEGPVASAVLAGDEQAAQSAMLGLVNRCEARATYGVVHIVDAGPGDPELLTVRAHRLLGEADAVVYDKGVDTGILERARRDAERIDVGENRAHKGKSQAEINALLAALARAGKRVVRLKAGGPFVFDRGNEELEYLRAHGVPVEVAPRISAPSDRAAALDLAGAVNA